MGRPRCWEHTHAHVDVHPVVFHIDWQGVIRVWGEGDQTCLRTPDICCLIQFQFSSSHGTLYIVARIFLNFLFSSGRLVPHFFGGT